jgi:hypothetical protein
MSTGGHTWTVHDGIVAAREAIEITRSKSGPYGVPVNIDEAAKRSGAAFDALEAEAAKENPDVRQLGKHLQAVNDGASWLGSRLPSDAPGGAVCDWGDRDRGEYQRARAQLRVV